MIDVVLSARRCQSDLLLSYLAQPNVKQVCEATGIDSKGAIAPWSSG